MSESFKTVAIWFLLGDWIGEASKTVLDLYGYGTYEIHTFLAPVTGVFL